MKIQIQLFDNFGYIIMKSKTVRARNLGVDSGHFFMRSDTHKMLELSHGVKP